MARNIRDWLQCDQEPANLYDLLGRPRFDPDHPRLLEAIRTSYAELLPYQNHVDPAVARRAMHLQMELGRAEALLSNAERLRAHHAQILESLRTAYAEAQKADNRPWSPQRLHAWLTQQQAVHPSQVESIALLVQSGDDETLEVSLQKTMQFAPLSGQPQQVASAPDPQPAASPAEPKLRVFGAGAEKSAQKPPKRLPPALPHSAQPAAQNPGKMGPRGQAAAPSSQESQQDGKTAASRRRERESKATVLAWCFAAIVFAGVLAVGAVVYYLTRQQAGLASVEGSKADKEAAPSQPLSQQGAGGTTPSRPRTPQPPPAAPAPISPGAQGAAPPGSAERRAWAGTLLMVQGHNGELHLLIECQPAAPGGSMLEAVTQQADFVGEVVDYRSRADEGGSGGDQVRIEGETCEPSVAAFRLGDGARLVQLTALERTGEPSSRAVVGSRRPADSIRSEAKLAPLAEYHRNHPRSGSEIQFTAIFRSGGYGRAWISAEESDRRRQDVGFPGVPSRAFAAYRPGDRVNVQAMVSPQSDFRQLVLDGQRICREADPNSVVTPQAQPMPQGPSSTPEQLQVAQQWSAIRSNPEEHLREKMEFEAIYVSSSPVGDPPVTHVRLRGTGAIRDSISAVCRPPGEAVQFLGGLSFGSPLVAEIMIIGKENSSSPKAALLWMARAAERDKKVSFSATANAEDIPGAELLCIGGAYGTIRSLAFNRDGSRLAILRGNGEAAICDAVDGSVVCSHQNNDFSVTHLAWKPDGKQVALADSRGSIAFWDVVPGAGPKTALPNLNSSARIRSMDWSSSGTLAAGAENDGVIYWFDLRRRRAPESRRTSFGGVLSLAWSPDGKTLAACHQGGTISIWDLAKQTPVQVLPPEAAERGAPSKPAAPDRRGSRARPAAPPSRPAPRPTGTFGRRNTLGLAYDAGPHVIAWKPDGKHLAVAADQVEIWLAFPRRQQDPLVTKLPAAGSDRCRAVAWNPDGAYLAACYRYSDKVTVWHADRQTQAVEWTCPSSVSDLVWSADGRRLATGHSDGMVRIWAVPFASAARGRPSTTNAAPAAE